jgi:hypothetical protein
MYPLPQLKNIFMKIVGSKVTTQRGVIWPRDSLLLGRRGREPREREREGAGASVRLNMI